LIKAASKKRKEPPQGEAALRREEGKMKKRVEER
jgi:hypothetical protein